MGSSPLTRGIQSGWSTNASVSRFTPAHAGNTSGQKSALCSMKVHPRSRGEYMGRNKAAYYLLGSPPLTRGILASAAISVTPVGFTPAHAGNTSCIMYLSICQPGSPPLTRGIRAILYMSFILMRFTPAHAGNTYSAMIKKEAQWVHPRSRGEYIRYPCPAAWIRGSPPLTRGILAEKVGEMKNVRFTPAHAGNTPYHPVL